MRSPSRYWLSLLLAAALPVPAAAQVVLDGTVGSAGPGPVASGLDEHGQSATYLIHDGLGERAGQNLFHSFSRFDVGVGETATFTSGQPVPPDNVLARVTGGSKSQIFGRLRSTIPGADLWLINPAGWLFGAGSSLDVAGSLHIASGDYVRHMDATRFGVALGGAPALSVAAPEAFGFLDSEVGRLTVEDTRLDLHTGETLSLVGGDIGIRAVAAEMPSGRLNLVAVASPGEVTLDDSRVDPQLDVDAFSQLGKIEVTGGTRIVYAGDPGGTAVIRGEAFLLDRSILDGTTLGQTDHPGVSADLELRGAASIFGKDEQLARMEATTRGPGRGGAIRVRADELKIEHEFVPGFGCRDNATGCTGILSLSWGGDPGDIDLAVRELDLSGSHAMIRAQRMAPSTATGGMIRIVADEVRLGDGTRVDANSTYSPGPLYATADAGDISIRAQRLEIFGVISSETFGSGRGGNVRLSADEILIEQALILLRTFATGDSGSIVVEGRDMRVNGSGTAMLSGRSGITVASLDPVWWLTPVPDPSAAGNAGSITVHVDHLELTNGGFLSSSTKGGGSGGDVVIRARSILLEGHGTGVFGLGQIGTLSVRPEYALDSAVRQLHPNAPDAWPEGRSAGDAGNIDIEVVEDLRIDGGWIASSTTSNGASGDVTIRANRVVATSREGDNPFAIESESFRHTFQAAEEKLPFDHGPAGNLTLIGTGRDSELRIEGTALMSARTETQGDGGELFVEFDRVVLDGGRLTIASAPIK